MSVQSLLFQQEELLSLERDLSTIGNLQHEKRAMKMGEVAGKIRQWRKRTAILGILKGTKLIFRECRQVITAPRADVSA